MKTSQTKARTIDTYVEDFPDDMQKVLIKIRTTIRRIIPNAEETISYGVPAFKQNGKYIVYFAGWKHHVSVYPIPAGTKTFQKSIAPFVAGRGTVKFPLDKSIPYSLIEKIAAYNLKRVSRGEKVPPAH